MMRNIWWVIIPVLILLFGLLAYGLTSNPKHIPSPLIGKVFPTLQGKDLNGNDVTLGVVDGKPTIVNVWASWCGACRSEHKVLLRGARRYGDSISLVAINYKDELVNARRWLRSLGDPYQWSFHDLSGRAGIELGVYGVPETFFVNKQGIIVEKISAPLTDKMLADGIALMNE
ncbi:MAG: DsbE family thiol:disulfide interchange protein [Sulfuriflexus sp.]|nr:DsbE family thiol:disulfide interchange protein [Sulfuriflexus sp.]